MQARDSLPHDPLLLAEIARLYYQGELSQDQIAQRAGVSRSRVSRMLKEARDRGIVEIRIHHPYQTAPQLEQVLKERLGLNACLVLAATQTNGESELTQRVGALAARYLAEVVPNGSILGVGWGSMVDNVVRSGYVANKRDMTIVQIQGGVGGATQDIDGARIVNTLARSLGAQAAYLHAPMVVADAAVRTGLLRDQHIRQTLDLGRRADALLVGVGAVSRQSGLYRAGYLNDSDLLYIEAEGAVGDICGHYFRVDGSPCPLEIDGRTVALPAEAMLKAPLRVGASSGVAKALPNIGAARSGLINVLVTDQPAAEAMLAIIDAEDVTP
ncbi:MAG: sugar-binding transcriptional regulator [Thermomicrobiales bacterium]|nr:sugar-binding transcriptional regulator [Thermomicrobiales bacterium]MCO5220620.1 sugar-binding transcriptional regulator [Thermomicrobiales bacterium]